MYKLVPILNIAIILSSLEAQNLPANPLSWKEVAEFLGPAESLMNWSRDVGPDFYVYYGRAKPPITGNVRIYLGGFPPFQADPTAVKVEGRLGMFAVKWQKTTRRDQSIKQEAVIPLDGYWKAHVVIEAENQADIDKLLNELSRLPTFTQKPRPVGVP